MKKLNRNLLIAPPPTTERVLATRHKAFSLAETLITIAIIGIIAAMTVPNLISKYQERAWRTAFLKNYQLINNAQRKSWADGEDIWRLTHNYDISGDNCYCGNRPELNKTLSLLKDHFKIKKGPYGGWCGNNLGYQASQLGYNVTNGIWQSLNGRSENVGCGGYIFQLFDGTVIAISGYFVYIDVNGPKKPNTIAKDVFILSPNVRTHRGNPGGNNILLLPLGAPGSQSAAWGAATEISDYSCKNSKLGYNCAYEIFKDINFKIPKG